MNVQRVLGAAAVLALAAVPVTSTGALARDASDGTSGPETKALDAVILVDESGSLSDTDVAREREAVSVIAKGMLNPRSRVTVVGFGSSNAKGQSAVDPVCPPTVLENDAAKQAIDRCAQGLKVRTASEGNDTDHAAALAQALSTFDAGGGPQGATRVVFLLTDGKLDVPNSPQWGQIPSTRNDSALAGAREQLKRAQGLQAQIWPLGFGTDIDRARLDEFAAGGAQSNCVKPVATVVTDRAAVSRTLFQVFAAASCGIFQAPQVGPPGKDFTVTVPEIATDGSIIVAKSDGRLKVHYVGPDGKEVPASGQQGDSEFSLAGQGQLVESLRIVNPATGRWTIRVDPLSGGANEIVTVMALWQGAVRAAVFSEPPSATPGQQVTTRVQLSTRNGPISSQDSVKGISVTLTATPSGDGRGAVQTVPVRDDGTAPDRRAGDGIYSGTYTAPSQEGRVQLSADVTGQGINANPLPMTLRVGNAADLIAATIGLQIPDEVVTGQTLSGVVDVRNPTGASVAARLALTDDQGLVRLASAPDLQLPPGNSKQQFTLSVPDGGRTGMLAARLALVDASDPQTVYGSLPVDTQVSSPPTILEKYWWAFVAGLVLLVAAVVAALLLRRAKTRRLDVSRLVVDLMGPDGRQIGPALPAPSRPSRILKFFVLGAHETEPGRTRLSNIDPSGQGITVQLRKTAADQVLIEGAGQAIPAAVAGEMVPFVDPLSLRIRRKPGPGASPAPASAGIGSEAGDDWESWNLPYTTSPATGGTPSAYASSPSGVNGTGPRPGDEPTGPVTSPSATRPASGPRAGGSGTSGSPPAGEDDPWM